MQLSKLSASYSNKLCKRLQMASTSYSYSKLKLPGVWNNDTWETEDAPLITPGHRTLKSKAAKAGVSVKKRAVALMKFLDGPAEL